MQKHISILGGLYIAFGLLGILVAVIVFVGAAGGGLLSGDSEAAAISTGVGGFVAVIIAVVSLPGLIAGYGLLKRKSWARIVAIVLGCLNLLNLPFGTALGIYTLWALTRPEATSLLSQ